jgi:hypothetical protein
MSDTSENDNRPREARVRRLARKRGLALRKPRTRSAGDYMLVDFSRNFVIFEHIDLAGAEICLREMAE